MKILPTGAALGAEVQGLDLSQPLDDSTVFHLREAIFEHCVLLFRHQHLSDAQQIQFTAKFGTPATHVRDYPVRSETEIFVVSNVIENGKPIGALGADEVDFHSDLSYLPKPGTLSILHALELPQSGSTTQWANAFAAYEALDESTKARISGLRAVHRHPRDAQNPDVPATHPVVRRHPESGRLALFVTPYMTRGICDLPAREGAQLLEELLAQVCRPEFVWTHHWQTGDVVMWDNRGTSHRRPAFPEDQRRILNRTQLFGDEVPLGPEVA
jgi:taurine dioxygenase